MTLSFSTTWPERMGELAGQPNYFIEKIWEGMLRDALNMQHENTINCIFLAYFESHKLAFATKWDELPDGRLKEGKNHTIRTGNRWEAGMQIHPVINDRTKDRFQFAPTMVCTGVQEIEIKWETKHIVTVYIDGNSKHTSVLEQLAINDGFNSLSSFFAYFNEDFKGQIVHWTDLRY